MSLKSFDQIDWITAEAKEFADYWRGLPRENAVPRRSSFDPTQIVAMLPGIAMYEVKSDQEVVSRLAGTELVEYFGQEITGTNMLELWASEVRGEASNNLVKMVEDPCGMIVKVIGHSHSGISVGSVAVGFPLLDESDVCNRLVFYSSGFDQMDTRISREDKIKHLTVARSTFISLAD